MLNDAYELHELVCAEGSHEVYRATDTRSRTGVRVKLLRPEFALQGAVVERFLREPRALSKLVHASLPRVRVDTDGTGIPFVVEDSVDGRTLGALIESFPQGLPLGMVEHLFVPLVEALALAHGQGLVHGALDDQRVRVLGAAVAPVPVLVDLGVPEDEREAGALAYRAPELRAGARPNKASDVFSLGVLLYRMLSGELPFVSGGKDAVALDEIAPQLPAACATLTAECLASDPARRIADAGVLLSRTRACLLERSSAVALAQASLELGATKVAQDELAHLATDRPPGQAAGQAASPAVAFEEATPAFGASASSKTRTKSAAQVAADKLGAKAKPRAGERKTEDAKPATKVTAKVAGSAQGAKPEPSAGPRESKGGVASVLQAKPAAATPAQPRGAAKGLTQGQIAAVALTEAQLTALRSARVDEGEARRRWLGLLFIVLFLGVLQLGVPLIYELKMARAQELLGPKLRLFGAGFAVTTVIAAVRMWGASISSSSLLVKVTSYTMYAVTGCVCLLVGTLYSTSPSVQMAASAARRALPWVTSFLFLMFTLGGVFRAMQNLAQHVLYGALVLALATGGLYGSYRSIFATVMHGKQLTAAQLAAHRKARAQAPALTAEEITKQIGDKTSMTDWQEQHSDVNTLTERTEVGANEADDLKATEELEGTRAKNRETLNKLQQALPVPEQVK